MCLCIWLAALFYPELNIIHPSIAIIVDKQAVKSYLFNGSVYFSKLVVATNTCVLAYGYRLRRSQWDCERLSMKRPGSRGSANGSFFGLLVLVNVSLVGNGLAL